MNASSRRNTSQRVNLAGSKFMLNSTNGDLTQQQTRRTDKRDYRWLLALAVACFFLVSVVTRILPRGLRPFAASGARHESCFEEARRMANAVIPYAFEW